MKIKLHFNRVNMQRRLAAIWSAHTYMDCGASEVVHIMYGDKLIAKTVFQPNKKENPRAWIEFLGEVTKQEGVTVIKVA